MNKSENYDFVEQLRDSYIRHMEHLFKCPLCTHRLSQLLFDAQDHEPELLKLRSK